MFNTAYIGLFERSLLPISLIQVELALKQATSKSRTLVSMYQFMGVFCGQNFEREYIDVLLNKLLLCLIIQIRK